MKVAPGLVWLLLVSCVLLFPQVEATGQVAVRYTEGLVHGFLVLRTPEGETLAHGDLSQTAHGGKVTSRLTFHFKDGSCGRKRRSSPNIDIFICCDIT
jgi:hypothetical protein